MNMKIKKGKPYHLVINSSTDPRVPLIRIEHGDKKPSSPLIIIERVRLDESNLMLIVNDGQREISFKSKKSGSEQDKATKLFKVLRLLWDCRSEIKNGKRLKLKKILAEFMTLDNLKRNSESPTVGATRQIIKRLNAIFRQNGLPMFVQEEKGKYKLIIKKGVA